MQHTYQSILTDWGHKVSTAGDESVVNTGITPLPLNDGITTWEHNGTVIIVAVRIL